MENTTTMVEMTPEQMRRFKAFQEQEAEQERQDRLRKTRDTYNDLVDGTIENAVEFLQGLSENIRAAKAKVLEDFETLISMRKDMDAEHTGKDKKSPDKKSLTFTHKEGTMKVVIGHYVNDDYLASAETGIEMIKSWIEAQSTDQKSEVLVSMVLDLLAKDAKGTLNAQNILKLEKKAHEIGAQELVEGVRIIKEAYSPTPSKTFIRCYVRDNKDNGWKPVPLGMTES